MNFGTALPTNGGLEAEIQGRNVEDRVFESPFAGFESKTENVLDTLQNTMI